MMPAKDQEAAGLTEKKLTVRDWLMMLAVSIVTTGILAGSIELTARRLYPESGRALDQCLVTNDPTTSARGIPNSFCHFKAYEDPSPIDYQFNSCGHRTGMECGPKHPGVYRIVMLGSSIAMAEHVQEKDSFAALLPGELARETGHPVELYNEGMGYGFSHSTTLRFNDALAEKPDLILWILTPMDVKSAADIVPSAAPGLRWDPTLSDRARAIRRIKQTFSDKSLASAITDVFGHTRTAILLRHLIFRSETQYVASYLMGDPKEVAYLQGQQSPEWQKQLDQFDRDADNIETRAKAAGVPLVAVFIPERGEADMISMGDWPKAIDPYKLDGQLRATIERHGGTFLDILPDFRTVPDPGQYYLPIDGHPMAAAHRLFAKFIAKALTGGAVPQLRATSPSNSARKQDS